MTKTKRPTPAPARQPDPNRYRRWHGIDVVIDRPAGSRRRRPAEDGPGFATTFVDDGRFRLGARTSRLPVLLASEAEVLRADTVWVIDARRRRDARRVDALTAVIGLHDPAAVRRAYLAHGGAPYLPYAARGYDVDDFLAFLHGAGRLPSLDDRDAFELVVSFDREGRVSHLTPARSGRDDGREAPELVTITMPDGSVLRSLDDVAAYGAARRAAEADELG